MSGEMRIADTVSTFGGGAVFKGVGEKGVGESHFTYVEGQGFHLTERILGVENRYDFDSKGNLID